METPECDADVIEADTPSPHSAGRMMDPVYDFPSRGPPPSLSSRGSPTSVSISERLLLTQPVWLPLRVNSATALHILQREPPGTFLVRRSNTQQQRVLCVRLSDDCSPSFIHQTCIHERPAGLSLKHSAFTFPDLIRLVSHYCSDSDVLPYTLRLPAAIEKVTSRKQLEAISHLGLEFWSSSLNTRDSSTLTAIPPVPVPPLTPLLLDFPDTLTPGLLPSLKTRSPQELSLGGTEGPLCFFNPLFQPRDSGSIKRSQFQRSVKVRVSTENSGFLSPPLNPPPPVPSQEAVEEEEEEKEEKVTSQRVEVERTQEDQEYRRPQSSLRQRLKKSLSKGSMELWLKVSPKDAGEYKVPMPTRKTQEPKVMEEPNVNSLPSMEEQDSASMSSAEEGTSEDGGKSSPQLHRRRKKRSGRSSFRAVSGAFLSLLSPERKMLVSMEEMRRDVTSEFGGELQGFLRRIGVEERVEGKEERTEGKEERTEGKEERTEGMEEADESYKALLKEVRDFMNRMKDLLRGSSELQLDTLVPEGEQARVLEKSLHRCILKPLRSLLVSEIQRGLDKKGELERLGRNMQEVQRGGPALLGVMLRVPGAQELDRIRQKLLRLQDKYSPFDKVNLLLQACQGVYRSMGTKQDDACGADEFLPALCYVLALCDLPQLLVHTQYMVELLPQDTMLGEWGYYLTSVCASLSVLSSLHTQPQDAGLSLTEWHRRKQGLPSLNDLQFG
ncbi:ras and Rab interactor 1 isoform X2 [Ascaphus truei]|uniref:ras and Rab interactor 1 isoform X2 n=1 Tax=Ascaphus truei TaxID=8439 RepID=UPI003F59197D